MFVGAALRGRPYVLEVVSGPLSVVRCTCIRPYWLHQLDLPTHVIKTTGNGQLTTDIFRSLELVQGPHGRWPPRESPATRTESYQLLSMAQSPSLRRRR